MQAKHEITNVKQCLRAVASQREVRAGKCVLQRRRKDLEAREMLVCVPEAILGFLASSHHCCSGAADALTTAVLPRQLQRV